MTKTTYSAKVQYAPDTDNIPVLAITKICHIRSVVGTLLYYEISVDLIMLVEIRSVANKQSKATSKTEEACNWLMDYSVSNPLYII